MSACYARRNRFLHPNVQAKLRWAFQQSRRDDFVSRLCDELFRRGVFALRWFVSGDVYSPGMAMKMIEVATRSPFCRMWVYSRSWRVPTIEPLLRAMAALPNMVVYYSCDEDTGLPVELPPGVRTAWLQTAGDEPPPDGIDLLFRDYPLRRGRVPLHLAAVVCPQEVPEEKARGLSCATCRICLTK